MAGTHPLFQPHVFSYMRRGGGRAAQKPEGEPGGAAAAAATATVTTPAPTPAAAVPAPGATAPPAAGAAGSKPGEVNPYETSISIIATVATVEQFWNIYDFLKRPNDLPTTTDYHFFREGIKPTWEDASNAKGGKWIIRLPKGLASRYWEEIILALIGGQFSGVPLDEICGAVLSVRFSEDILGVWNRSIVDREMVDKIRDAIKKILQLPPHANMEYKPHQASLQDRSSFRNTQVWKPKSDRTRSGSWSERETTKPKPRESVRGSWRQTSTGSRD